MIFKADKESVIENHKKDIDLLIQANQGDGGAKHNILDPSLKVTHVPCNCI